MLRRQTTDHITYNAFPMYLPIYYAFQADPRSFIGNILHLLSLLLLLHAFLCIFFNETFFKDLVFCQWSFANFVWLYSFFGWLYSSVAYFFYILSFRYFDFYVIMIRKGKNIAIYLFSIRSFLSFIKYLNVSFFSCFKILLNNNKLMYFTTKVNIKLFT